MSILTEKVSYVCLKKNLNCPQINKYVTLELEAVADIEKVINSHNSLFLLLLRENKNPYKNSLSLLSKLTSRFNTS